VADLSLARFLEEQEQARSVADLGMWRSVGAPEWTAVFPAGNEPDPGIVKAIRVFAPHYVPLWLRKAYRSPTGDLTAYEYHVVGMHTDNPTEAQDDWEIVNVIRPPDWPARFMSGQINVVRVLWDDWKDGTWQKARNFPRQYVPYDWRLVDWMRRTAHRVQQETQRTEERRREALAALDAQFAAEDKAVEKLEADTKAEAREDAFSLLQAGMKGERVLLNGPQFAEETKS
jgi:hypothetical protein